MDTKILKVMYENYCQSIKKGYTVLTYEKWLELKCFKLMKENKEVFTND